MIAYTRLPFTYAIALGALAMRKVEGSGSSSAPQKPRLRGGVFCCLSSSQHTPQLAVCVHSYAFDRPVVGPEEGAWESLAPLRRPRVDAEREASVRVPDLRRRLGDVVTRRAAETGGGSASAKASAPPRRPYAPGVAVPVHALDWLTADLVATLGPEQVSTSEAVRGQHAAGESYHRGEPPDVVVFPGRPRRSSPSSTPAGRTRVPIVPFGAGTSLEGQIVALRGGVSST